MGLVSQAVTTSAAGILLELILLPLAFTVGWLALRFILHIVNRGDEQASQADAILLSPEGLLQAFTFGLLLILTAEYFLLSFGLPWNIVTALVLFLGGATFRPAWGALEYATRLAWRQASNLNFGLWLFITCVLGTTLISSSHGIGTPWLNNYGDVAWHIGMITSFTFGRNFPPQYHIFPGERLSYPFFMNLWTSAEWWVQPSWWMLGVTFFIQWLVCWTVIFAALRGNRNWLLPWAALFGGGSFFLLFRMHPLLKPFQAAGGWAHNLFDQGFPFAPFLTTVWVTQRPAVLGSMVLVSTLAVFHRHLLTASSRSETRAAIAFIFLPLAFGILAHTHLFAVTVLYLGCWFLLDFACVAATLPGAAKLVERGKAMMLAGAFLLPALLFLPVIWGKKGAVGLLHGWMPYRWFGESGALLTFLNSIATWFLDADMWIISALLLVVFMPRRRELCALFLVFLLGNFVRTSFWEWDQMKVFIGIYLAFLSLWAFADLRFPETGSLFRKLQVVAIGLIIPGLSECSEALFRRYQMYTVYSESDVRFARTIQELTPIDSIILAAPDHNSPVTLSGRFLFSGYNGTLSSHGLNYSEREQMLKDLEAAARCSAGSPPPEIPARFCPKFLLWTEREKRLWPGKNPASMPLFKKTAAEELWEILPEVPAGAASEPAAAGGGQAQNLRTEGLIDPPPPPPPGIP